MKVKIKTNIDPNSNEDTGLKFDTDYEVEQVIIHGWSTDVYLEGFEYPFNGVIFDESFEEAWEEALEWFDENEEYYYYGCFVRDYY